MFGLFRSHALNPSFPRASLGQLQHRRPSATAKSLRAEVLVGTVRKLGLQTATTWGSLYAQPSSRRQFGLAQIAKVVV